MARAAFDDKVRMYHVVLGVRDASPYLVADARKVEATYIEEDGPVLFSRELYFTCEDFPTQLCGVAVVAGVLHLDYENADQVDFAAAPGTFYKCITLLKVDLPVSPYYQTHIRPLPFP